MVEAVTGPEIVAQNNVDLVIEKTSTILSYGYVLSVLVTIYDVFCDVVLNSPTVWVYDVVTTAIAVAFLVGGSYAAMRREHIRITVLYDHYGRRGRIWCDVIGSLGAIVYLAVFTWFSWKMASLSVMKWEVSGSVWAQPTPVIVKVSMVLGALLMIVQLLSNIRGDLRSLNARA